MLEEINLSTIEELWPLKITKELATDEHSALVSLLSEYRDVFIWSYSDMKGMDPRYYQHQIHLKQDVRPMQQRRYWMNPNYATKVKEEIDKC